MLAGVLYSCYRLTRTRNRGISSRQSIEPLDVHDPVSELRGLKMFGFSARRSRGAIVVAGLGLAVGLCAPALATAETLTFSPGPQQTFVVPSGVTHIHVIAVGQSGGEGGCAPIVDCSGGKGEKVGATLTVTPGQKLYVDFAGAGASNGGGAGGNAADVRTISSGEPGSLTSRLLVAGGGGGAGGGEEGTVTLHPGSGGNAGASVGEGGQPGTMGGGAGGGGGTETAGGAGGAATAGAAGEAGQLGIGGTGGAAPPSSSGGGGGGGYYGGGGGGGGASQGGGAGGGSSFVKSGATEVSFELNKSTAAGVTITYTGGTETVTFIPGVEQTFTVPIGVARIEVTAIGQSGEESTCAGANVGCQAGFGERVSATLNVTHGQKLYADFLGSGTASGRGGAGGNASDLRAIPNGQPNSLQSRLIVAGGGGGAGEAEEVADNLHGGSGGNAGSTTGEAGAPATPPEGSGGGGGNQKEGGAAGTGGSGTPGGAGSLGQGGRGGFHELAGSAGGGGGGYYGGGGGAPASGAGAGGGGGSSFVTPSAEVPSFAVNSGNAAAGLSISYTSAAPPSASITSPTEAATYTQGQSVIASFSCAEGSGGPGLKAGSEGCGGTVANGAAIETSTPGEHHFTVTANSQDGLSASRTVSYTVAAPPSVTITTPAEGATYLQGQAVDASYSCAEGSGGPGLKAGSEGCGGTVANGAAIETSTPGEHHFAVTATSKDGQSTAKTHNYTVVTPPVFGRCLKTAGKGMFKNAACTEKLTTGTGNYEWSPGPGPKTAFSLALKPKTSIKLETAGKHALLCTGASGAGKITGLKTVSMEVVFTGCAEGSEKCSNTGTEGDVGLSLAGTLAWQNKALNKLDLKLAASSFVFAAYECPNKVVLLGTNGILLPVAVNKSSAKATDSWAESKGKQVPDQLEGESALAFEEDRIVPSPRSETVEGCGLHAALTQTYEEPYEINTSF